MIMTDMKRRGYAAPEMELAELPLVQALCEMSSDLVDVEEEDSGIGSWDEI